jgi:hypothetical protein
MPFFKTTQNILKDNGEYFNPNWMDSDELLLPPKTNWDYGREMKIEDVDIWEVISEVSTVGIYAAWTPYAEFYLIKPSWQQMAAGLDLETFYGPKASERLFKRAKELGITLPLNQIWVDSDQQWLY